MGFVTVPHAGGLFSFMGATMGVWFEIDDDDEAWLLSFCVEITS